MSIMSDKWIREQAKKNGMIEPFVDTQKRGTHQRQRRIFGP